MIKLSYNKGNKKNLIKTDDKLMNGIQIKIDEPQKSNTIADKIQCNTFFDILDDQTSLKVYYNKKEMYHNIWLLESSYQYEMRVNEKLDCLIVKNLTIVGSYKSTVFKFSFDDLIGIEILDQILVVHTTKVVRPCSFYKKKEKNRKIQSFKFYFKKVDNAMHENFKSYVLKKLNQFIERFYETNFNTIIDSTNPQICGAWKKNALVIVNPVAGEGNGKEKFLEIEKYLVSSGYNLDTCFTEQNKHAVYIVKNLPRNQFLSYHQIICVGGNGLVHEVINGFMLRSDRCDLKLVIGCIGLGHCSATSATTLKDMDLPEYSKNLINSIYAITRSKPKPLAIFEYETDGPTKQIFGFHSFVTGFPLDNMEMQDRLLFSQMFKIPKILRKKKCTVWCDEKKNMPSFEKKLLDEQKIFDDELYGIIVSEFPYFTKNFTPSERFDSGCTSTDLTIIPANYQEKQ